MKRKRYTPCPVLVHPTMHPKVSALREKIYEFIGKHRRG